jgi:L-ascorbate metabolism protein UlaG (beta-lactamase superfamily)
VRNFDPAIAAEAYDWGERVDIGPGITVTPVAASHWSARNLSDRNMALWASFVIETPGGRIFLSLTPAMAMDTISALHERVTGRLNSLFSPQVLMSRVGSCAIIT